MTYVVPDADKEDICHNTPTQDVRWRNITDSATGEVRLEPTYTTLSVGGWTNDCDFVPSEDHPYGQFCTPYKRPEGSAFPPGVDGYNSFDNILLSWLAVFQHVSHTPHTHTHTHTPAWVGSAHVHAQA